MTWRGLESGFSEGHPRVNDRVQSSPDSRVNRKLSLTLAQSDAYSAAAANVAFTATNDGLAFAADMMKSEMRGTISDLNRDPLKTP